MAASPTGLVIAAALMAAFAGFPILLLCKDYFFTEYALSLSQGCLEGGLAPQKPPRPETRRVLSILSPGFPLFVPDEISLHTLLVLVDRIVRLPFASKPNHFAIRKHSHKLVRAITRLVELHSHRMLILTEI
jgi:hypothetical protein